MKAIRIETHKRALAFFFWCRISGIANVLYEMDCIAKGVLDLLTYMLIWTAYAPRTASLVSVGLPLQLAHFCEYLTS